jgi:hypothetical protein
MWVRGTKQLAGFDPIIWGLAVSLLSGVIVSLRTAPPDAALVSRLFDVPAQPREPSSEDSVLAAQPAV